MAEANISVDQNQLKCSVCLDLLKDPMMIPCGHNYCKRCITDVWDQDDQKGIYRCPLCKQSFTPRPVLCKNVMIAEMVEKLKKTRLQATASSCICMMCLVDEHKNHDTVSTAAARTEKQRSAQTAVEDSERIFTELILSIEKRHSEVKQLIRDQERAAVNRAEMKLERLEQEIDELKRRNAELKQLSETQDHVHFLQSLSSASVSLSGSTDGYSVSAQLSFDDVMKSVSQLRDKLQQFCREEIEKITETVEVLDSALCDFVEPDTGHLLCLFSSDFHPFTLDPNTVNSYLYLSEGNTVITSSSYYYSYPDHPDRFENWMEALYRESVTERRYWEVEWSGEVYISVAYNSIMRKGSNNDSRFGCNDQSWRLYCCNSSCSFWYNNMHTDLPVVSSSRVGVYVDHSAGIFVSDTMSLIYRVQTTFTQPLYPGIGLGNNATAKLCRLTM
uniref:Tripartite motif-containing protein 16-like n=1 Tax=Sinocyclocheilus rhinocerous TaxID=307959 RepID=A0A673N4E0_9TELE